MSGQVKAPVCATWPALAAGVAVALASRGLMRRAVLLKLRGDVAALNAGDYRPVLSNFSEDAVLRFNEGTHRWAGEHRGREAIERFLQNFVAAGLQGEVTEVFFAGAPWKMTLLARFDDRALDPSGEETYHNRTVLLARSRWGKIVLQEDFYEDTARIDALDARLAELGVEPVA